MSREPGLDYPYEPEEEREVPLDDEVELELPPPTLDPDERIEPDDGGDDGRSEDERPA